MSCLSNSLDNSSPQNLTDVLENENQPNNKTLVLTAFDMNDLKNDSIKNHNFLEGMYSDSYFPGFLVDKCKTILLQLCLAIETQSPKDLTALYSLTHKSTEQINDLEGEFYENGSEIETAARECLGFEFSFIAKTYGFEADVEELIAPRNW